MGNRIIIDERYEEGVVHIDPKFIKKASEDNQVKLLARENSSAVLGSNLNIYFKIRGSRHVLMHIKRNWYTVIDERVWCKKTMRWIHVARRLANGFHFTINEGEITTQPRRKHNCQRKTLSIYRIIMSLTLYNKADKLKSAMDVHHVMDRYINTLNCLRYVDEVVHRKYHSISGNESKREGKVIESYADFCAFLRDIQRIDSMASVLPM